MTSKHNPETCLACHRTKFSTFAEKKEMLGFEPDANDLRLDAIRLERAHAQAIVEQQVLSEEARNE